MWNEFPVPAVEEWLALLAKESQGKTPEQLSSRSPEGLTYPACAEAQLEGLPGLGAAASLRLVQALPPRLWGEARTGGADDLVFTGPQPPDAGFEILRGPVSGLKGARALEMDLAQAELGPIFSAHPNLEIRLTARQWLDQGLDAVHELAWMMGGLIEALRALPDSEADKAAQISVTLTVGPRLLLEVAKLRAAHILAGQVMRGFGQTGSVELHLIQDRRFLTAADPHNHLLRSTIAGLVACLGGAASIELVPLDDTPEAARWARNVVHLLRLESKLGSFVDPLLGCGAVEALTRQMAEKAWAEVQRIEASGGLKAQTDLDSRLEQQKARWMESLRTDRLGMVGVNRYVSPYEGQPGLTGLRWAQPFEELMARGKGREVKVVTVGDSALVKARLDYVKQWLGMAGIVAQVEDQAPGGVWILCCEDDQWSDLVARLKPPVVAGKLPFEYSGLTVFRGCDRVACLEKLLELLP